MIATLSILGRQKYIKNAFCKGEKNWSESFQSQWNMTVFKDHLGQETLSFLSIFSDWPDYSIGSMKFRDQWEFIYFLSTIANDRIAVKYVIDENKNFRCKKFIRIVLGKYTKLQPYEVDFSSGDGKRFATEMNELLRNRATRK